MADEEKKPDPTALCASCVSGIVMGTVCMGGKFNDVYIFCGYFKDSPLKFRGAFVTNCTRYKRHDNDPGKG